MPLRKKKKTESKKFPFGLLGILFLLLGILVAMVASSQTVNYTPHAQVPPTPTGSSPGTDLVITDISRDSTYYRAKFCNKGIRGSTAKFAVKFTNQITNKSYTLGTLTPFSVPPPGSCAWTRGAACSHFGSTCKDQVVFWASADSTFKVTESIENNNWLRKTFYGTCTKYIPADYNQDGIIDGRDFAVWLNKHPGVAVCVTPTPVTKPS